MFNIQNKIRDQKSDTLDEVSFVKNNLDGGLK